jgi:holo-[acyl-carrier protein] synthase
MIVGIGSDLVSIQRIQEVLNQFGERFISRILAPLEQDEFHKKTNGTHFLAKKYAAKEAAVKALGIGFRQGITHHDVIVIHDDYGKPLLKFENKAFDYFQMKKIIHSHLTLSDEHDYALAFVVLET